MARTRSSKKADKMPTFGSRAQVMNGTALKTRGDLFKKDLMKNKRGTIVSKKASAASKRRAKNNKAFQAVIKCAKSVRRSARRR